MAEQRETERAEIVGTPFEHLATKEDVANVRTEIAELRGSTNTQGADLRTYVEQVQADLIERIAGVDKNVESIRAEMRTMKWMMGIVGRGCAGATVGALLHLIEFERISILKSESTIESAPGEQPPADGIVASAICQSGGIGLGVAYGGARV